MALYITISNSGYSSSKSKRAQSFHSFMEVMFNSFERPNNWKSITRCSHDTLDCENLPLHVEIIEACFWFTNRQSFITFFVTLMVRVIKAYQYPQGPDTNTVLQNLKKWVRNCFLVCLRMIIIHKQKTRSEKQVVNDIHNLWCSTSVPSVP